MIQFAQTLGAIGLNIPATSNLRYFYVKEMQYFPKRAPTGGAPTNPTNIWGLLENLKFAVFNNLYNWIVNRITDSVKGKRPQNRIEIFGIC